MPTLDSTVVSVANRSRRLEMELRRAIEQNELTLFYQSQFQVADGRACGVEVLVGYWI